MFVAVPRPATADSACGTVFTVNTRNQLLTLGKTSESLAEDSFLSLFLGDTVFVRSRKPIAGLAADEAPVGIDFRPFNGMLYGVGRIGTDAVGRLYTIDPASAR
jgi:hypothetical protein